MNPIIDLNAGYADPGSAVAALAFSAHNDDPQLARATPSQQLLFANEPRSICQELGLNWLAAVKLFEDGWLSFSPEETHRLDEAQECELRFVGSLVVAGCDRNMLVNLLGALPKPYAYWPGKVYFDWQDRRWRLLPEPHPHPETVFTEWLEKLITRSDLASLTGIIELTHDAISRLQLNRRVTGDQALF